MKKILAIMLSLSLLTACSSGSADKTAKDDLINIDFVLDFTPNTNHTGLYVAKELGYYEDLGLNVNIIQPPEDGATSLVASGKAPFGISFQESISIPLTLDTPMPITAVATIIEHNTSGIIAHKDSGIASFADMEGKTYSTWETPLEQAILSEVMSAEGADFNNVIAVPAGAVDAVTAIQTDIDTVWVYEAWDVIAAQVAGVPYNFIKFSDAADVLDFYTPIIIANNTFLSENPETAKAFMEATAKGYEYAISNPAEAAKILVKCAPELDLEMVTKSQEYLANEYKAEKEKWGYIDNDRWTAFYDWSFEKGLIDKELGSNGYTNEFLP